MSEGLPEVGATYVDYIKRTLKVTALHRNDPKGREVRGIVSHSKHDDQEYSCTLEMWREIWRDKLEPLPYSKMRIG